MLKSVGEEEVVGVDECEIAAPCGGYGGVTGRARAGVRLPDQAQARVGFCETGDNSSSAIGRAVVDHDYLQVALGLRPDRFEALRKILFGIVGRYDYGHFRSRHRGVG